MIYVGFLSGITMATFAASGLFFFKLWRTAQDRLFLFFALSCWLLSAERVASLFIAGTFEHLRSDLTDSSSWIYLIRSLAFIMIFVAVVEKNRGKPL